MKTIRCVVCRNEFSDAEAAEALQCPSCGDTGIPMKISEDLDIKINWHELRILCIWARNYAESISKELSGGMEVIESIEKHISKHRPPGAPPITLKEETDEQKTIIIKTDSGDIKVFIPKKGTDVGYNF